MQITHCLVQIAFLDVDECSLGNHTCDSNAQCNNIPGSYTCRCNYANGYYGNGTECFAYRTYNSFFVVLISLEPRWPKRKFWAGRFWGCYSTNWIIHSGHHHMMVIFQGPVRRTTKRPIELTFCPERKSPKDWRQMVAFKQVAELTRSPIPI